MTDRTTDRPIDQQKDLRGYNEVELSIITFDNHYHAEQAHFTKEDLVDLIVSYVNFFLRHTPTTTTQGSVFFSKARLPHFASRLYNVVLFFRGFFNEITISTTKRCVCRNFFGVVVGEKNERDDDLMR